MTRRIFLFAVLLFVFAALPKVFAAEIKASDFQRADMSVFEDPKLCAKLKKGTTPTRVAAMKNPILKKMAEAMLAKKYETKIARRVRKYRPYYPVDMLAAELKTSPYSRFENPTGVYFESGETVVVFVGSIPKKEKISLKIHCFDKEGYGNNHTYDLQEGVNVFTADNAGLAYLNYYSEDLSQPAIRVNVATGHPNGVFTSKSYTNADWEKMLADAKGDCIDIMGDRVQLVFCAKTMQKVNPKNGREMIDTYNEIIRIQQEDIMGLTAAGRRRPNHMHGRTMWTGFMHADGMGAAFNDNTMGEIADPAKMRGSSWGIAHEFGHVNQTRPNLKWVCLAEVTNNIFSCAANFKLNPSYMRLEHEVTVNRDNDGTFIGGRFNSYLNSAIVYGEQWLCQKGPDKMSGYEDGGDHFVKVAPLWQLQLYFSVAGRGPADFYPQIFERARKASVPKAKDGGDDNGAMQCEFMKNVCEVTKQNLMPFFETIGMLKPIDKELDDYTRGRLKITESDCKKLKAFGDKFPAPESPVIYYISANNYEVYKDKLPIKGSKGAGIEKNADGSLTVSHKKWKNVVAFETYADEKLVRISMSGLGFNDNSATRVLYPAGATRVEAVGWDGKRVLAYGKPGKSSR
ncbi:MAG: M60 family metallopeptidase [Opitutae bacterium]|nr:M60 family metallopeptidase [Opitutae bacterium]